jgi:hypothetical protein
MKLRNSRLTYTMIVAAIPVAAIVCAAVLGAGAQQSARATATKEQPYVVEYYYKARWGHAEEFLTLFKRNHFPVLKKEMELGRMLNVFMTAPRYLSTEDGRWDYRVTIVFNNAGTANDNFDSSSLIKQLYPDQDTYKKEEQRRFEILEAHWDLPIKDVNWDAH